MSRKSGMDEQMILAAVATAHQKMKPTLISFPDGTEIVLQPRKTKPGIRGQHAALVITDELTELDGVTDEVLVAEARRRKFFVIGNAK